MRSSAWAEKRPQQFTDFAGETRAKPRLTARAGLHNMMSGIRDESYSSPATVPMTSAR